MDSQAMALVTGLAVSALCTFLVGRRLVYRLWESRPRIGVYTRIEPEQRGGMRWMGGDETIHASMPPTLVMSATNLGVIPVVIEDYGFTLPNHVVIRPPARAMAGGWQGNLLPEDEIELHFSPREIARVALKHNLAGKIEIQGHYRADNGELFEGNRLIFDLNRWSHT